MTDGACPQDSGDTEEENIGTITTVASYPDYICLLGRVNLCGDGTAEHSEAGVMGPLFGPGTVRVLPHSLHIHHTTQFLPRPGDDAAMVRNAPHLGRVVSRRD